MASYHVIIYPNVEKLLRGQGVRRDMMRRGKNVQTVARALAPKASGALAASIYVRGIFYLTYPGVEIGTPLKYGLYQHEGTGIYGPRRRYITPRRAKFLVFRPKGSSKLVFARRVRGVTKKPFLKNALPAAAL